jgi:hypothetical protein
VRVLAHHLRRSASPSRRGVEAEQQLAVRAQLARQPANAVRVQRLRRARTRESA